MYKRLQQGYFFRAGVSLDYERSDCLGQVAGANIGGSAAQRRDQAKKNIHLGPRQDKDNFI